MGCYAVDIKGQRFGRLVVIRRAYEHPPRTRAHAWWECRCDCGKTVSKSSYDLRGGRVKSCGCLRADMDKMRVIGKPKSEWWPA